MSPMSEEESEIQNPFRERKLLDHGYVKLVASMGTGETIIEAARMSTGKGFEGWEPSEVCGKCGTVKASEHQLRLTPCDHEWKKRAGDARLLEFLYSHQHMTPFEMCELHLEVQAPILVFREWHRHRTQSFNETSARYVPLPDLNYIPSVERLLINANASNKQAGTVEGAAELSSEMAEGYRGQLGLMYANQEAFYQQALKMGVPKELARAHLPVGRYSKMRVKTDLRNWLGFLQLRQAPGAQWEIRQYAHVVAEIVNELWPLTYALYLEHTLKSVRVGWSEAVKLRESLDLLAPVSGPKSMPKLFSALRGV